MSATREVMELHDELSAAQQEIERWKEASGIERGRDPSEVRPEDAQRYWQGVERERDDLDKKAQQLANLLAAERALMAVARERIEALLHYLQHEDVDANGYLIADQAHDVLNGSMEAVQVRVLDDGDYGAANGAEASDPTGVLNPVPRPGDEFWIVRRRTP